MKTKMINNYKKSLLLVLMFCAITGIAAQEVVSNSDRGYYLKDNKVVSGIAIEKANQIERSERVIIPNQITHPAATLYPDDIEGYGFAGQDRYISGEVMLDGISKKVFLEEIFQQDSITVYYYPYRGNDRFFLQVKDDTMLSVIHDPEELWELFRNPSCPEITQLIDLKKKKLSYGTINVYRKAYLNCNTNVFPKFRIGVTTEAGGLKPSINKYTEYSFDWMGSFMAGLFVHIPIDECFSFHPEVLYSRFNTPDFSIDYTELSAFKPSIWRENFQLPMVFRYNFNYKHGKMIPYIDVGLLLDIKKTVSGNLLIGNPNSYTRGELANSNESRCMYGFIWGGGVEHKISSKHSVYTGIRFRYVWGDVRNAYIEQLRYITFNIAYGFSTK